MADKNEEKYFTCISAEISYGRKILQAFPFILCLASFAWQLPRKLVIILVSSAMALDLGDALRI